MTQKRDGPLCRVRRIATALLTLGILAGFRPMPLEDPPSQLRFQARLVDGNGSPVDQTVDVVFNIYDSPVSGVPVYTEEHTAANPSLQPVTVSQGLLSVVIGTDVPLQATLLEMATEHHLGVTIGTDSELAPRFLLSSVPFALRSVQAEDVPGKDITPNTVSVNGQPVIDSLGNWVGVGSPSGVTPVAFHATYSGGSIDVLDNVNTLLVFPVEVTDTSAAYDPLTGIFTTVVPGTYVFHLQTTYLCGFGAQALIQARIFKNTGGMDELVGETHTPHAIQQCNFHVETSVTSMVTLGVGDQVKFFAYQATVGSPPKQLLMGTPTSTWVHGYRVH